LLKGVLLLRAIGGEATRPTRDIDLLGHGPPTEEQLLKIVQDVNDRSRSIETERLFGMGRDPWPHQHSRIGELLEAFHRTFAPRLQALDADAWASSGASATG
jgi:hypothetical protein